MAFAGKQGRHLASSGAQLATSLASGMNEMKKKEATLHDKRRRRERAGE